MTQQLLRICPHCKSGDNHPQATVCKHCGRKLSGSSGAGCAIAAGVVLILVGLVFVGWIAVGIGILLIILGVVMNR